MAYEWFISYRRKSGGENQARQVAEILSKYVGKDKVFYDRESMREGNWREQINAALKSAKHFVLLVNEASAAEDQSNNVGGYRYEIETALNLNKEITLIEYDKKSYNDVTAKYPPLKEAQKVTFNGEYNFAFEERLCKHFKFDYKAENASAPTIIKNITIPENLVTRRDMLDKLDHEFNSHQCVVISGIGGSGKTSLAYLYIKEQNFNNVAWVTVNGKIEDVFLDRIAGLLFSKEDYEGFTRINDKQTKLDIIKSELSKIQGKNLLVFDINTNNEAIKQEIESELYNYLPAENWKTLILTRARVINATRFSVIEMGSMAEEDTINLFKNNYGGDIQFTDMQLAEIAQELYYHPLLIEQTAIYFSDGIEDSAEEIIDKIKDKNKVNNERTNEDLRGLISEGKKEKNIKNYLLNLCNIENLSPEEVKFLTVYVTWPTEPISKEIIKTLLPGTEATQRTLIKKGIISRNGNQYVIHSLMADVIREQINISEFDYADYLNNVNNILWDDYKSVTLHRYSKCIASSFINYGICEHIALFYAFLNQLLANNDVILYQLPMPEFYHLANEFEKKAEPDDLANLYNSIARVEVFKNNLDDAKMHYGKALEVIKGAEENENILYLKGGLLHNLAILEVNLDDTDSAKKHYEEAVEIFRKLPETPKYLYEVANTLGKLADLEEKLGETDSAKKHLEEAIEIGRKQPETPQYLDLLSIVINNLAALEYNLGDTVSAKKHIEDAVEVKRKMLELTETPMYLDSLAVSLHNLANLEDDLGDTNSAKQHYEESLEIGKKLPETPQYLYRFATTLGFYAGLEENLGDTDSAKKHYEEGLKISRQINNDMYIKFFERKLSSL